MTILGVIFTSQTPTLISLRPTLNGSRDNDTKDRSTEVFLNSAKHQQADIHRNSTIYFNRSSSLTDEVISVPSNTNVVQYEVPDEASSTTSKVFQKSNSIVKNVSDPRFQLDPNFILEVTVSSVAYSKNETFHKIDDLTILTTEKSKKGAAILVTEANEIFIEPGIIEGTTSNNVSDTQIELQKTRTTESSQFDALENISTSLPGTIAVTTSNNVTDTQIELLKTDTTESIEFGALDDFSTSLSGTIAVTTRNNVSYIQIELATTDTTESAQFDTLEDISTTFPLKYKTLNDESSGDKIYVGDLLKHESKIKAYLETKPTNSDIVNIEQNNVLQNDNVQYAESTAVSTGIEGVSEKKHMSTEGSTKENTEDTFSFAENAPKGRKYNFSQKMLPPEGTGNDNTGTIYS